MNALPRVVTGMAVSAFVALAAGYAMSKAQVRNALLPATGAAVRTTAPPTFPVVADYRYRNAIVNELEADVRRHPDQLNTRMLAGQYLQRFRETSDVTDLLRAVHAARTGLALQPRYNIAAELTLASAYAGLHKFSIAEQYARDVRRIVPWNADARATQASLAMELGNYTEAAQLLSASPARADITWKTSAARYAELTGNLAAARALIARAIVESDGNSYAPAENRAWYHWRAGELAFEAGDVAAAEVNYKRALVMFPHYWHATNGLAKAYWAQGRWQEARTQARASADVFPLPETLGYLYDAQRALHDDTAAATTIQLIRAIERIGNSQRINDRLIASFYSDHHILLAHAVAIARRDLAVRDDIYAEDTLAWALAMDGQWRDASQHAERAARLGTQDPRLQFHVGMIELRVGQRVQGLRRLRAALAINPHFHPFYASEARTLAGSRSSGP